MHPLDENLNQFSLEDLNQPENSSDYNSLEGLELNNEMYIYEETLEEGEHSFKIIDSNTPQSKIDWAIQNEALAIFSKTAEGKIEIKTSENLAAKIHNASVINLIGKDNAITKVSTKDVNVVISTADEINRIAVHLFQMIEITNKRIKERQEEIEREKKDLEEKRQAEARNINKNVVDILPQKVDNKRKIDNIASSFNLITKNKIKSSELKLTEIVTQIIKNKKKSKEDYTEKLKTIQIKIEDSANTYFDNIRENLNNGSNTISEN